MMSPTMPKAPTPLEAVARARDKLREAYLTLDKARKLVDRQRKVLQLLPER